MKRIWITALLLCAAHLFAVDGGALVGGYGEFTGKKFDAMLGRADVSGWVRAPFLEDGSLVLSAEARYRFEDGNQAAMTNMADLSLLKLSYTLNFTDSSFSVSAGRFGVSDLTGVVYNQPGDGFAVLYQNQLMNLSVAAQYTGLINSLYTTMNPIAVTPIKQQQIYSLSVPVIANVVSLSFPQLFAGQTIAFGVQGYWGVESMDAQRMYGTFLMSGPIVAGLYYNIFATGELLMPDTQTPYWGIHGRLEFAYYLPYLDSRISVHGECTTVNFDTITSYDALLTGEQYGDITKFGFSGSLNAGPVLTVLSGDAVFRTSDFQYHGFELNGGARWQIVSDVQLSASAGYLFASPAEDSYGKITVNALIAL